MGRYSCVAGSLLLHGLYLDCNWKCQSLIPSLSQIFIISMLFPRHVSISKRFHNCTPHRKMLGNWESSQKCPDKSGCMNLDEVMFSHPFQFGATFHGQVLEWPAWLRCGAPCYLVAFNTWKRCGEKSSDHLSNAPLICVFVWNSKMFSIFGWGCTTWNA